MSQMREDCLVQRQEKREASSCDVMKSKDIMRKVEKIRRKKLFQQKINPVTGKSNVFEAKLRMLRQNNRSLAKALSEQKMEANHWYSETIALKGELQETHEKLLRMPYCNSNIEHVFVEAEKQIKECYKSIDKDFSLALERIVDAVEKLTKAKQLVGSTMNILQFPCQTPLNTFSRLSGSRTPLGASGVGPPRQRAVLPMVSGHVLQPAMVPLPKLNIRLSDRRKNCIRVHEESDLDMSTIGEQSSVENGDVSEEHPLQDSEEHQPWSNIELATDDSVLGAPSQSGLDTANLGVRPGVRLEKDTLRSRTRCKAESSAKLQATASYRRQGISRRGAGRGGQRREDCRISKLSPAKVTSPLAGENEVLASTPDEEDPLEGPSWLHGIGDLRGAFRGRYRGRRMRINNQEGGKKTADAASLDSSDQVVEAGRGVSKKLRHGTEQEPSPRREAASTTMSPTDSQSQSLDYSCLDSPTSMLARLELLEAQGGRKSKRFIKSKLSIAQSSSEWHADTSDSSLQENEELVKGSRKKMLHTLSVSSTKDPGVSLMTENKEGPYKTSSAQLSESIEAPRDDNDLTCQIVTNMDVTQPVSGTIIQQNQTSNVEDTECLQDEYKPAQPKKRFFKTKEQELIDEIPKVVERTPFDLSMLNESVVSMPPFSSTRTTEKENLQPLSGGGGDESITLRDVSVVLKDVIKESMNSDTPKRSVRVRQKGNQPPKRTSLNSPRRPRRVSRTLRYPVNYDEESDEMWNHKWERQTVRRKEKRQSPTAGERSIDSTSDLELKRLKKSAAKSHSNDLDDPHRKSKEDEITSARVLSNKTENTKILPNCYVRIQRTSIMETPSKTDDDQSSGDLLHDLQDLPDLQQLFSENQKGKPTEMIAAADVNESNTNDGNSRPVNTERDTTHVKEYDKGNNTGMGIDEPEIKFCSDDHIQQYVKEPYDIKQIHQIEGTLQHDEEETSVAVNPADLAKDAGCQETREQTGTASPRVTGREREDEALVKSSSGAKATLENTEEPFIENHPRKRRAALKITSFKEVGLNRKMRRGENNLVCVSAPEIRDRNRSRGRGRNRGRSTPKVVEDEMS